MVKACKRSIAHALSKPMLDWIVVNIIYVVLQVGFVTNRVLPIQPLPQTFFSLLDFAHAVFRCGG